MICGALQYVALSTPMHWCLNSATEIVVYMCTNLKCIQLTTDSQRFLRVFKSAVIGMGMFLAITTKKHVWQKKDQFKPGLSRVPLVAIHSVDYQVHPSG